MDKKTKKSEPKRPSQKETLDFSNKIKEMKKEIARIIVGQEVVVNASIRALISNGHIIVEGVPGIAKTLLVRALGRVSGCDVQRIQFTVDLLPTDIVGLTIYRQGKGFEVVKGPVFANFIIADEINRAPPKTQSALLEAMQEKQVSIGRKTFSLPRPFFVMSTQNPIEQAGVYNLPEAQIDRFMFKLLIDYPNKDEEKGIMNNNIDLMSFDEYKLKKIISPNEILKMQELVKEVYISDKIQDYILNIVSLTRDRRNKHSKYIEWGASPRASIYLFIASKAEAFMNGRNFVKPEDVKAVALDVLRHRILLNYEAEAEKITSDRIIKNIIREVKVP